MPKSLRPGYTLIEIVVAFVIFTTGALGLAAGSAIVAREMSMNGVRAQAGRLATARQEMTVSTCLLAQSGREVLGPVTSVWTISRDDSSSVGVAGTVSYPSRQGIRSDLYSVTVRCQ